MFAYIKNNKVQRTFTKPFNLTEDNTTTFITSNHANVLPVRTEFYDKEQYTAQGFSEVITETEVVRIPNLIEKSYTERLEKAIYDKLSQLKEYVTNLYSLGFTVGANDFDIDATAQRNILAEWTVAQLDTNYTGATWVLYNNTTADLTRDEIITLGNAARSHVSAIVAMKTFHREAIKNLLTIEEVEAYDFTVNFPNTVD